MTMTANKNALLTQAAGVCRIPRTALGRSQSVSPPPVLSPVGSPSYPLSDSEEFCRSSRLPAISSTRLIIKDWTLRGANVRDPRLASPDSDSSNHLQKAVSVACLDKRLSVFKGPVNKENTQEGEVIGNCQLNRSTLSLGSAANQRNRPHNRTVVHSQVLDIRRKISEWECRRDPSPRLSLFVDKVDPGERSTSEGCPSILASPCSEKTFDFKGYRRMSRTFSDCSYPETEEETSEHESLRSFDRRSSRSEPANAFVRSHARKESSAVLNRIQKIEQALKENPSMPRLPSSCFSVDLGRKWSITSGTLDSLTDKPGTVNTVTEQEHVNDKNAKNKQGTTVNSGGSPTSPDSPANEVNPVPKPKRTFEYEADKSHRNNPNNGLPLSPSPVSPPPLPSTPAPPVTRRPKKEHHRKSQRKSLEFEDASSIQSLGSPSPVENGTEKQHRTGSKSTLEENAYEDIVGESPKENPYEDVDLKGRPRKSQLSPDGLADPSNRMWRTPDRKYTTPPQLVQRINSIYSAKRGKKRLKKLSMSNIETSSLRDENSESESDSDDRFKAHTQRLVHIKSMLNRAPSYRTLELELIEWQERELFEYFVVVSMRKKPSKNTYIPEVSYQFPKLERPTKQMREAEERLKAIPQFCFPDARDWMPVSEYHSETFSFMLTGEDGSRRFGYCRRLLPSGKGPRLPEVYCVISRLGCFDLFSKILDEVERRRGISAALVYPFMRSLMESPFPAPGKTIKVKTFLPGAGNEVIELRRPMDSRLEHVDFECLFACLGVRQIIRIFASLLLERRVIFVADKLSTLSSCSHAVVALLYPFSWQHTFIPVLPSAMIDIVCCPTPFLVGLLSSSLPKLKDLPVEEALMVDLGSDRFIRQMDDEDALLPRKLQAALEQALERKRELIGQDSDSDTDEECNTLNGLVSEVFIRFFVETIGHYSLFLAQNERGERVFQKEAFRKSVASKSIRRFLEVFMESQMFAGFIQDRELRKCRAKGLFEQRVEQYLEELPEHEQSGVNKFWKGLGNKMKFLHKKN
ncbi:DENN domain-containing protein 2B isoform X2 [Hyperolius riggenbachi]|uniref:DENN domain-containing protein 2B isoform X2 n=1 Tax=Hyperolius riggenbachi TaxID=752182 RepID=UPI0035A2A4BD